MIYWQKAELALKEWQSYHLSTPTMHQAMIWVVYMLLFIYWNPVPQGDGIRRWGGVSGGDYTSEVGLVPL